MLTLPLMKIRRFPDLEAVMIRQLDDRLLRLGWEGVRVASKKADSDSIQPVAQVVISDDGGFNISTGLREHGFRVNVWAATWEMASSLAMDIEAVIPTLPTYSEGELTACSVDTSATRIEDPTGEHHRFLTGTSIIRANTTTTLV